MKNTFSNVENLFFSMEQCVRTKPITLLICGNRIQAEATLTMEDLDDQIDGNSHISEFLPIDLGGVANKVVWTCLSPSCNGEKIYDNQLLNYNEVDPDKSFWQMKSNITQLTVPVIPYSGYRVFFDWVSETPDETAGIEVYLTNSKDCPGPLDNKLCGFPVDNTGTNKKLYTSYSYYEGGHSIYDYIWSTEVGGEREELVHAKASLRVEKLNRNGVQNNTQWGYVDIQAMDLEAAYGSTGPSSLDLYFSAVTPSGNSLASQPDPNYSVRLLSVSGALLPINTRVETIGTVGRYVCDPDRDIEDVTCISPEEVCADCFITSIPSGEFIVTHGGETVVPDYIRPIKSDVHESCEK